MPPDKTKEEKELKPCMCGAKADIIELIHYFSGGKKESGGERWKLD